MPKLFTPEYFYNPYIKDLAELEGKKLAITGVDGCKAADPTQNQPEHQVNSCLTVDILTTLKPSLVITRMSYLLDFVITSSAADLEIETKAILPYPGWEDKWSKLGHSFWSNLYREALAKLPEDNIQYLYEKKPPIKTKDMGVLIMKPLDYMLIETMDAGICMFDPNEKYTSTAQWFFRRSTEKKKPCINMWGFYQYYHAKVLAESMGE